MSDPTDRNLRGLGKNLNPRLSLPGDPATVALQP